MSEIKQTLPEQPMVKELSLPKLAPNETSEDLTAQDHCTLFQRYQVHEEASYSSHQRIKHKNALPQSVNLKLEFKSIDRIQTVTGDTPNTQIYLRLYSMLRDQYISNEFGFSCENGNTPTLNAIFTDILRSEIKDIALVVLVYRIGTMVFDRKKTTNQGGELRRPWCTGAIRISYDTIASLLEGVSSRVASDRLSVPLYLGPGNDLEFEKYAIKVLLKNVENFEKIPGGVNMVLSCHGDKVSELPPHVLTRTQRVPRDKFSLLSSTENRNYLSIDILNGRFSFFIFFFLISHVSFLFFPWFCL